MIDIAVIESIRSLTSTLFPNTAVNISAVGNDLRSAVAAARSSASVDDSATDPCFLLPQSIRNLWPPSLSMTIQPDTDFRLSMSPAWSASQYTNSSHLGFSTSLCTNATVIDSVAWTYPMSQIIASSHCA
eukprot:Lankesteria_metandrocarpae@DN5484_c1_g1_i2.p1